MTVAVQYSTSRDGAVRDNDILIMAFSATIVPIVPVSAALINYDRFGHTRALKGGFANKGSAPRLKCELNERERIVLKAVDAGGEPQPRPLKP